LLQSRPNGIGGGPGGKAVFKGVGRDEDMHDRYG
jgi:hypothetical protein